MGTGLERFVNRLRHGSERRPLMPSEMLERTGAVGEVYTLAEEMLSRGAIVRFVYGRADGSRTLVSESGKDAADCVEVAWGVSSRYNTWNDPLCGSRQSSHEISMMYGVRVVASAAGELKVDVKKPSSEGWISFAQYLEQTEGARDRLEEDPEFSRTRTPWVAEVRFAWRELLEANKKSGERERSLIGALP